jgi:hypothetical protein
MKQFQDKRPNFVDESYLLLSDLVSALGSTQCFLTEFFIKTKSMKHSTLFFQASMFILFGFGLKYGIIHHTPTNFNSKQPN